MISISVERVKLSCGNQKATFVTDLDQSIKVFYSFKIEIGGEGGGEHGSISFIETYEKKFFVE